MSHPLVYGVRGSPWRSALGRLIGPAMLGCLLVLVWPMGMDRFHRLEAALVASRHRSECFKQCATYEQTGVAFDEANSSPVLVVDDNHPQAQPRWYRSRADDPGVVLQGQERAWWRPSYHASPAARLSTSLRGWDQNATWHGTRIRCLSCLRSMSWPVVHKPSYWVSNNVGDSATLYLHGRRASKGQQRVVIVTLNAASFMAGDPRPLEIQVFAPAMPLRSGSRSFRKAGLGFACTPIESLRFHFGQSDALDASRFTIAFEVGTRIGKLEGWLQPDDTVKLLATERAKPRAFSGASRPADPVVLDTHRRSR